MAIDPLNATVPQPSVSFLTPDGGVSRPWLYYLLTILTRTGGQTGISSETLQQQIGKLLVETAMLDDSRSVPAQPLSILSVMDGQDVAASQPTTLGMALVDDTPRVVLDPFLASLMVADSL